MTRPRGAAAALDPDAERLWDRLRAEFQLHDGFWLAFLFGAQTVELTELIGRTRDLASVQVAEVQELRINSADDVGRALGELLTPARPGVLATWLLDEPIASPEVRREWWSSLLRRLNERRDALRAARPGAVVLACPPDALGLVRDEAPDLWSYRSLTATLRASRSVPVDRVHIPAPQPETAAARRVAVPPAPLSPAVADYVRQVARALRSDRMDAALAAAQRAVEASRSPSDRAVAGAWLARVRLQQGDAAEALRLAREAWLSGEPLDEAITEALLGILIKSPIPVERAQAAEELEALAHESLTRTPDSPDSWRNLSVALDHVGEVRQDQGDLDAALAAFTESLQLRRRLTQQYGTTPQALRDLSLSLNNVGRVQRTQGDLDAALAAFTESLELRRRLTEQYGTTPQALRDLSISLNEVGKVQRTQGDLDAALAAFTESLELRRRLTEQHGTTPQAIRDLSISLNEVGGLQRTQGDLDAALATFTESLELRRQLTEQYGSTPKALRDLSISLNNVGKVQRDRGCLDAALAAFTESLELRRQLAEQYGTTPQALRDLSISLNEVGGLQRTQGDLDAALAAFTESLELRRRLTEQYGTTPQALRDLSISLNEVGGLQRTQGDLDAALAAFTESLELRRRLTEQYGTPQALRDLSVSLDNVGGVQRDQGNLDVALTAFTESLELRRRLIEQYGSTPQALRDLALSLSYLGQVHEQQGELLDANRAYAEAITWCTELNDQYPGLLGTDRLLEDLLASVERTAGDGGTTR